MTASFLKARASAAKAQATIKVGRQRNREPNPVATEPTVHAARHEPAKPQTTAAQPQPKPAPKRAVTPKRPANRKGEAANLSAPPEIVATPADERVIELFRTHSPNTPAFELAKAHLPGVFRAIILGAQIKGVGGVSDRHTLFRMLGAPWTPSAQVRGESASNLDALADRLVKAISRREQRVIGREPVTIEAELVEEPQPAAV